MLSPIASSTVLLEHTSSNVHPLGDARRPSPPWILLTMALLIAGAVDNVLQNLLRFLEGATGCKILFVTTDQQRHDTGWAAYGGAVAHPGHRCRGRPF